MTEPLSPRNPRVKRLGLLLAKRAERRAQGAYVIEGPTLVADAIASGAAIEAVFVDADDLGGAITDTARAAGVEVVAVVAGGLARVLDPVSPRPVAAVVSLPAAGLAACTGHDLVVVLAGVADPGNAGTILRTAEATGAGAVVALAGSVDLFAPKVVRASAGAVLRLPLVVDVEPAAAVAALADAGFHLVGTTVRGGTAYDAIALDRPIALVLGSEAHGVVEALGPEAGGTIEEWVTIPMQGEAESINVAVAAAVLCFDVRRRLRAAGGGA